MKMTNRQRLAIVLVLASQSALSRLSHSEPVSSRTMGTNRRMRRQRRHRHCPMRVFAGSEHCPDRPRKRRAEAESVPARHRAGDSVKSGEFDHGKKGNHHRAGFRFRGRRGGNDDRVRGPGGGRNRRPGSGCRSGSCSRPCSQADRPAYCDRIDKALPKRQAVVARLEGDANTKGSIAWLTAKAATATSAGNAELAKLYTDRAALRSQVLDPLKTVTADLDGRPAGPLQLIEGEIRRAAPAREVARCVECGQG